LHQIIVFQMPCPYMGELMSVQLNKNNNNTYAFFIMTCCFIFGSGSHILERENKEIPEMSSLISVWLWMCIGDEEAEHALV